jgi:hypothetical protein
MMASRIAVLRTLHLGRGERRQELLVDVAVRGG